MEKPVQPNYFEFYGVPLALAIDAAAVRRIYLDNSRKYHPDFHTRSSDEEQNRMLELSTINNEAFKTFSDPDRLLQYVLKIKGLLGEEGNESKLPQDFLMEMMDINEKIMELEFDPAPELYAAALKETDQLEKDLEMSIGNVLTTWTEATGKAADLEAAKEYLLKKRYLLRVKENLSKFASAFEK